MERLPFVKMEGAGNDYIYLDAITHAIDTALVPALAVRLSDRHYGVGADGVIVLAASERADCRMLMWNADGTRAEMCGNGIRCLAVLAHEAGHVPSMSMTVESDSGIRQIDLITDAAGAITGASVDMGEVSLVGEPATVTADGAEWTYYPGDAGNPHAVIFCDRPVDDVPVARVGSAVQQLPAFPQGVNVEFVRVLEDGSLEQRTYERGSGETLACGSGATVAALAAIVTGRLPGPEVSVRLRGGTLIVRRDGSRLVMAGPARTVFHGEVSMGTEARGA